MRIIDGVRLRKIKIDGSIFLIVLKIKFVPSPFAERVERGTINRILISFRCVKEARTKGARSPEDRVPKIPVLDFVTGLPVVPERILQFVFTFTPRFVLIVGRIRRRPDVLVCLVRQTRKTVPKFDNVQIPLGLEIGDDAGFKDRRDVEFAKTYCVTVISESVREAGNDFAINFPFAAEKP